MQRSSDVCAVIVITFWMVRYLYNTSANEQLDSCPCKSTFKMTRPGVFFRKMCMSTVREKLCSVCDKYEQRFSQKKLMTKHVAARRIYCDFYV